MPIQNNLVPGWSFESPVAGPPNADWADWVETETPGLGAATVEADNVIRRFGVYSLQLTITDNTDACNVTSAAFITIDNTAHYVLRFSHYKVGGANTLDVVIKQYNAASVDLADDIVITPAGSAAWALSQTVIHAAGDGGNDWHANCAKVKLIIRVDTTVANWRVDGVSLAPAEEEHIAAFGTNMFINGYEIIELTSISGPTMAADAIDVSSHDSVDQFREFAAGMKSGGDVTFAGNFYANDATGQIAFETSLEDGTELTYHIIYPSAGIEWLFQGNPTAFAPDAPFDGKIPVTMTVKVTGKSTLSEAAF